MVGVSGPTRRFGLVVAEGCCAERNGGVIMPRFTLLLGEPTLALDLTWTNQDGEQAEQRSHEEPITVLVIASPCFVLLFTSSSLPFPICSSPSVIQPLLLLTNASLSSIWSSYLLYWIWEYIML